MGLREDVDARRQAFANNGRRQPRGMPLARTGHEHNKKLRHWVIESLSH
jgi:hypothetical protein